MNNIDLPQIQNSMLTMRPQHFKDALVELMNTIQHSNLTFVEIGCYRGESTEVFLQSGKIAKMYCIDPWLNFYDSNDLASSTQMNDVMSDFVNRIMTPSQYKDIVSMHRGTIESFIIDRIDKNIDNKIDVVYIDANHTYDACKNDIFKSLFYLKPQIAICGHDYYPTYGVFKAVNEVFGKPDMTFADTSWLKFLS